MKKLLGVCMLFIILVFQTAWAQVPVAIQGVAIDSRGVPLPDGNKNITFFLYESADSETPLWSEPQTVPIENGIFRAQLGKVNALDLPFEEKPYWLGMRVGDGEELKPRIQLRAGEDFAAGQNGATPADVRSGSKQAVPDRDGAGVNEDEVVTAEADKLAKTLNPDIVHNDDVIITFSLCVGNDCVNGESFGFDTIRLKENNLRIKFDDTSVAASFPRNDWQIRINDSANGGGSYFAVEDVTGGRTPFRVDAGARANALYVDSQGDVGIGTSTPVTEIHARVGDTPTLRLEQDGSSGFTPQTWDVAGNEAGFFVRDVTNGSTLPFRIRLGAPSSSIDIQADGDVGIGTTSPATDAQLHVVGGDFVLEGGDLHMDNDMVIRFKDTAGTYREVLKYGAGGGVIFTANDQAAGGVMRFLTQPLGGESVRIDAAGNVGIGESAPNVALDVNGDVEVNNVMVHSDRRWKKNINGLENALDTVLRLEGVNFEWRTGEFTGRKFSEGRQVGLIAQEVESVIPEIVQTDPDGFKSVAYTNVTPFLIEAIKEQQQTIEQLRDENKAIRAEVAGIKVTLSQLHSILQLPVGATPALQNSDLRYLDVFKSRVDEYLEGIDANGRPNGSARPIQLNENQD